MSSTDILINALNNCNVHNYNTGVTDGLFMGFAIMLTMMMLIAGYDFYKSYKFMLDKLNKMDANTILELNEEIQRTNKLPQQLSSESANSEIQKE